MAQINRTKEDWLKLNVFLGDEVDPLRIADDAMIHPGCRINGTSTSIGPGSEIGAEAPATLTDCQLGRDVKLAGGYFSGAVFFDGANMGSGAHVRAGTILEEEANGAHTVGLKQTILLPFVTLGSLINFCDILMAGGTSRKDHSEVGSSYIHFNFTPHQDKATASLVGDVPHGVLLDQKPIFLGGQGGLIGPARVAYGSVIAAGGVCRKDQLEEDQLHVAAALRSTTRPYEMGVYGKIEKIVKNNLLYIGNILALREWYRNVRSVILCRDEFDKACLEGGLKNLDLVLGERVKRLGDLANKMEYSIEWLKGNGGAPAVIEEQQEFQDAWPEILAGIEAADLAHDELARHRFMAVLESVPCNAAYITVIQSLDLETRKVGQAWLQSIVDRIAQLYLEN